MFASERHQEIIDLLKAEGKVKVKELSERYEVSEDCIRKDLKTLEVQGLCKRAYGGAILVGKEIETDVSRRLNTFVEVKKEIAQKAFDIIQDKETIYLDVSTTNVELAKLLANGDKRCTVVTNMIDILLLLAKNPNLSVIALGGNMHRELNGFVGAPAMELLSKYRFDRCFVGSAGVDFETLQLTTAELDDALVKEMAVRNSKNKYLMVDERKFEVQGVCRFSHVNDFTCVITNTSLTPSIRKKLNKHKIKYI